MHWRVCAVRPESGGGAASRVSARGSDSRRRQRVDGNASTGPLERTGRPPRPPGSGGRSTKETSPREGVPESDASGGGAGGKDQRREDSALLSAPSHFDHQNPRVAGILQQHSSFLEEPSLDSPGQRAAAVIMGADTCRNAAMAMIAGISLAMWNATPRYFSMASMSSFSRPSVPGMQLTKVTNTQVRGLFVAIGFHLKVAWHEEEKRDAAFALTNCPRR